MFRSIALPQIVTRHDALGIAGLAIVDGLPYRHHRQCVWNDAIERVFIDSPTRRLLCGVSIMSAILTLTTLLFPIVQGLRMPIQQAYSLVIGLGLAGAGNTAGDIDLGASTPDFSKHLDDGFGGIDINQFCQISRFSGITGDRVVDAKPIGMQYRSGWYWPSAIPSLT